MIDPSDRFVFLPLLYELAVGDADVDEVAPRFEELLGDDVKFNQVEHIKGRASNVEVRTGGAWGEYVIYNYIVYRLEPTVCTH